MKTKIINLYGGPGVGKSTLAADLYAQMKKAGHKVEMVREVAKKWAWQGREIGPFDQMAILGTQMEEESGLFGKVDYIITDSPSFLGAIYLYINYDKSFMMETVKQYYDYCRLQGVEFKNYILPRTMPYLQNGRFEDENSAKMVDAVIQSKLIYYNIDYEKKIPKLEDFV